MVLRDARRFLAASLRLLVDYLELTGSLEHPLLEDQRRTHLLEGERGDDLQRSKVDRFEQDVARAQARRGTFLHGSLRGARRKAVLQFTTAATRRLHELIAPYVHPSMAYKLLPAEQGRFAVEPQFVEPCERPVPATVLAVAVKPRTRSMHRFDLEVEGTHNYFVDRVMVHNSPGTTTGGRALKFYASIRLDVRRIETLKDGADAVGSRTRVKVVKNKVSPPFKQAEFDILYGIGISREGGLIDMGVEQGIVRKSGAWYTYEGDQLGQGKENARAFMRDNPDLADEVEKRIKEKLGVGARIDLPAEETAAVASVDF